MAEFEINLRDIFRVARRRRWILLLAPTLVGSLTYFFTQSPPPLFEAESLVKITRVAANMQQIIWSHSVLSDPIDYCKGLVLRCIGLGFDAHRRPQKRDQN